VFQAAALASLRILKAVLAAVVAARMRRRTRRAADCGAWLH